MLPGFRRRLAVAVTAAAIGLAPAAWAETLTDALISAYNHSGLLDQNRALLRAADEDVAIGVSSLRPVISYALNAGWKNIQPNVAPPQTGVTTSASATLSASLLLYDFGRRQMGIDLAKENVLATREMLVTVEQGVLLRAVSAYLGVRRAQETVALQSNNVRLITQELRAANDRYEVGEITQTNVSLAEARLAGARSAEAAAQGGLIMAREEYRAAVGRYPGTLAPPPAPPMTVRTVQEAKALARQRHPNMKTAQHNVTIAELNVQMAMMAMKPSLSANASSSLLAGGATSTQMGVTLSGPIYQGGRLSALYRKAVAQSDAARSGLHLAGHGIDQGVANAWAQLAVAAAGRDATDRQIRATRVALRGTREEADLGARTTLDVLNAEQDLLDAQASAISAQSDQYLAVYSLLSSMGLLTADHLRLGIATYDPAAYYNAVKSAPITKVSPQGEQLDNLLKALGQN